MLVVLVNGPRDGSHVYGDCNELWMFIASLNAAEWHCTF